MSRRVMLQLPRGGPLAGRRLRGWPGPGRADRSRPGWQGHECVV